MQNCSQVNAVSFFYQQWRQVVSGISYKKSFRKKATMQFCAVNLHLLRWLGLLRRQKKTRSQKPVMWKLKNTFCVYASSVLFIISFIKVITHKMKAKCIFTFAEKIEKRVSVIDTCINILNIVQFMWLGQIYTLVPTGCQLFMILMP